MTGPILDEFMVRYIHNAHNFPAAWRVLQLEGIADAVENEGATHSTAIGVCRILDKLADRDWIAAMALSRPRTPAVKRVLAAFLASEWIGAVS